jgi:murein DD-endopeptidase MepM/ murein hydrolase activator NlpD
MRQVTLFGGEIVAGLVEASVESSATAEGTGSGFGSSRIEGLAVNGAPVAASANQRVDLGDWGYAVLLEQAVVTDDADGHGIRSFVTGIHVILTADHGGFPAGTEILVGYAEAAAHMPAPKPPPEPTPPPDDSGGGQQQPDGPDSGQPDTSGNGQPEPSIPREPDPEPPGASPTEVPAIVRNPPPGVRPEITGQGYVFPVWGPASFSDDFGAPRATTGWHHGQDIFAPLGAPVLAVSDGTLFLVGWNDVGGHRLWLRDGQGNEYYYAHLSAYSPLAVNGTRVEAGDVLGFVGATGDAAGTPYHLHFEIHPAALLGLGYDGVVNPYEYLTAWNARRDSSPVSAAAPVAVSRPGAVILGGQDIAGASGLDPGAIEQAFEAPLFLDATTGFALPSARPVLFPAQPGFAS